jgi:glycosyltransferase involved in cell wall biosynthesis
MDVANGSVHVVIPCYNESARFRAEHFDEFAKSGSELVMWFVNDGSEDGTGSLLHDYAMTRPFVRVITLEENQGKANALRVGMVAALGSDPTPAWVGYMDADGSYSFRDFCRFTGLAQDASMRRSTPTDRMEVLCPSRRAIRGRDGKRGVARLVLGNSVSWFLRFGQRDEIPADIQAGIKLLESHPRLARALAQPFRTRWFFEWELLLRIRPENIRFHQPLVRDYREVSGSRIDRRNAVHIAREVALIKMMQARTWRS